MASYSGGLFCAHRACISKARTRSTSFFRFPKDVERARDWLKACNRDDLLGKSPEVLYGNYRLCELHFEKDMLIKHKFRKLLIPEAVPTIFPHSSKRKTGSQTITDSHSQLCPCKISELYEATPDTTAKENIHMLFTPEEESAGDAEWLENWECDSLTESIETPAILSSDTSQEIKLKNEIHRLKRRLKGCEAKLQETKEEFLGCEAKLQETKGEFLEEITLDDYMNLTFKFCRGNIELAHFINVQVSDLSSEDK
ncbi:hypothetical protein JTB14_032115 [Gonioctena quinquepunctata]|nr:hypothetical protein JTB14_032115 [Gonioctena quinquepunctata]